MNSGDTGGCNGRNNNINRIINNIINHNSIIESENESRPGSDNSDSSPVFSDDLDIYQDNSGRRTKYHRHTPQQIHELEKLFKECPHPDEKQRLDLSRRLKLDTRQVKFWFQNRRTHMKTQIERHENSILKNENEKLRTENISAKEAMSNPTCKNCGGPAILGELDPEQHRLIIENVRLKDELQRICALAGKFLGRPISNMSSSLNLAGGHSTGFVQQITPTVSPDMFSPGNNQLVVASSNNNGNVGVDGDVQKSMLLELASAAMDELIKMAQIEEPLWMKDGGNGRAVLNIEEYERRFVRCLGPKPVGYVVEASRESGVVLANSAMLVDTLMDANHWMDMFPCLIAKTTITEIISSGIGGTRNGALQLMQASFQVLAPLVPIREVKFLRFCKQHADGIWAIVDVTSDGIGESPTATNCNMSCQRLPSGCILQDMHNGYCKVTWVEHTAYDESRVHKLYRPLLKSGLGLGAQRWLATLQRQCECLTILIPATTRDHTGMTTNGKRSLLELAQRMTKNFCVGVCASSPAHKWSKVTSDGSISENIRVLTRQSMNDPGEPHGVVLSAATSVSLPLHPQQIFDFLRDVKMRSKWDILANGCPMQEMPPIVKGLNPGNAVSLLRSNIGNGSPSSMLILQETCTDASGSLVVYAPVDIPAVHLVMNGGDSACVALLPSGFVIVPDGPYGSSSKPSSLLTVAFQILVNSLPNANLSVQSVETVNNLIASTVKSIKDALVFEK